MTTALKVAQDYAELKAKVHHLFVTIECYGDCLMGDEELPLSHYQQSYDEAVKELTEMEAKLHSVHIYVL